MYARVTMHASLPGQLSRDDADGVLQLRVVIRVQLCHSMLPIHAVQPVRMNVVLYTITSYSWVKKKRGRKMEKKTRVFQT